MRTRRHEAVSTRWPRSRLAVARAGASLSSPLSAALTASSADALSFDGEAIPYKVQQRRKVESLPPSLALLLLLLSPVKVPCKKFLKGREGKRGKREGGGGGRGEGEGDRARLGPPFSRRCGIAKKGRGRVGWRRWTTTRGAPARTHSTSAHDSDTFMKLRENEKSTSWNWYGVPSGLVKRRTNVLRDSPDSSDVSRGSILSSRKRG